MFDNSLGRADYDPGPGPVSGQHTFTTISGGSRHACALGTTGRAWCWGDDDAAQLGDEATGR